MNNMIQAIPAAIDTFYMCPVNEIEYIIKAVVDGEVMNISDNCGLEHEWPLSFDLDGKPESVIRFDGEGRAVCFGEDEVEKELCLVRKDGTNLCRAIFTEDFATKEDLHEDIAVFIEMEAWERNHFLEWLCVQEEVKTEHGNRFSVFNKDDLLRWVELYYRRDVTVLADFVLENLAAVEMDVHLQSPRPDEFKEFSANHSLVPVERQSKFVGVKGDTLVIFNGRTWKIIYVY